MNTRIEGARRLIAPPLEIVGSNLNAMQEAGFRAGYQLAATDDDLDLSQATVYSLIDFLGADTDDQADYHLGLIIGRIRYAEELIAAMRGGAS